MVVVSSPPGRIPHPTFEPNPIFYHLEPKERLVRIFNPNSHNTQALTFRDFGPILRFDHHRRDYNYQPKKDPERGIYYAAFTLSSCLVEVFGDSEFIQLNRLVAIPIVTGTIKLLDLRGSGAMRAGSVAALSMIIERNLSQEWSCYFYNETDIYSPIDGLIYSNAHNGEDAIALYERAEDKLECPKENIKSLEDPQVLALVREIARDHHMNLPKKTNPLDDFQFTR